LQKINAVKMTMPDNPKVTEVYQRKLLEFANLTPDEISEIMDFERQKKEAMQAGGMVGMPGQAMNGMQPQPQGMMQQQGQLPAQQVQ
jgi:hypothetical protein